MLKLKRLFAIALTIIVLSTGCLLFASCETKLGTDLDVSDFELSWEDNFVGKNVDTGTWSAFSNSPRRGGYWDERQLSVSKGNLTIRTEYKDYSENAGYYTGAIKWKDMVSKYGYYEVRCKLPDTRGMWVAVWMMPKTMGLTDENGKELYDAKDGAELDIMESAEKYVIHNTVHFDNYTNSRTETSRRNDLYDGYHTFGMDWRSDSITFYYDRKELAKMTNPKYISQAFSYLKLTCEINGKVDNNIPKPMNSPWITCGNIKNNNESALPADFIIDYIRVYDNGQLEWSTRDKW